MIPMKQSHRWQAEPLERVARVFLEQDQVIPSMAPEIVGVDDYNATWVLQTNAGAMAAGNLVAYDSMA